MMTDILYLAVTLFVISCNSVFTHDTNEPEGTETCAFQCGRDIQQMFHSITLMKNNISTLELKEEERQNKISTLETNLTLSNKKIRDLRGLQSENNFLEQRIKNLECLLSKTKGISNCAYLYKLGHREDKAYTLDLCGKSYQLYCEMTQDGGGWTVIQRRFDGSVSFFRNWDSYKTGFGNLSTEFWLGNDLISLLTKHNKYVLHIDLEDFEGEHRYAKYSDFRLGDEDEKYTLYIGSYSGNAGDSLAYHKGKKFSTYDNDNDLSSTNCAVTYEGAFWFNNCHHAHLNGRYSTRSRGAGHAKGLRWNHWKGDSYSLKKSTMKIRPRQF